MRYITQIATLVFLAGFCCAVSPVGAAVYGTCRFDSTNLRFAGSVADTASCLLRRPREKGTGADRQPIPSWLSQRMTRPVEISPEQIRGYLAAHRIDERDLTDRIAAGDTPSRRYFVIHDTSDALRGAATFPPNINEESYSGNDLTGWESTARKVNLITSRDGRSRLLRDWSLSRPGPATKLEENGRVPAAREVFVHVENIQPRLNTPGSYYWRSPTPGFTPPQEQRLALAYVVASMRAGRWLIPAYHFNVDDGMNAHDDPQHTDLASWVARIEQIVAEMNSVREPRR